MTEIQELRSGQPSWLSIHYPLIRRVTTQQGDGKKCNSDWLLSFVPHKTRSFLSFVKHFPIAQGLQRAQVLLWISFWILRCNAMLQVANVECFHCIASGTPTRLADFLFLRGRLCGLVPPRRLQTCCFCQALVTAPVHPASHQSQCLHERTCHCKPWDPSVIQASLSS